MITWRIEKENNPEEVREERGDNEGRADLPVGRGVALHETEKPSEGNSATTDVSSFPFISSPSALRERGRNDRRERGK